ncbi:hypothetical protein [Nocardioides sp. YIM 152588]|uniref:hypothetical protein n=1 Tax=Nocardioides sp. YIM 152588 TaxID=3158259 RepID=UPI0032E4B0C1
MSTIHPTEHDTPTGPTRTPGRSPLRRTTLRAAVLLISTPLALSAVDLGAAVAATEPPAASAAYSAEDREKHERRVEAALDRLRADGMLADPAPTAAAENAGPTTLAKEFGGRLLSEAFSSGTGWAFDEVIAGLGLGSGADLTDALRQLGTSISALQADVTRILQLMHEVLHGQDKANFYNSYTQAGIAASRIDTAARSVADWVENDLTPSEKNVSDMALVVNTSMGELDFLASNPVTGTIPLMMKAADASTVTDFDWDYYDQIDEVRDGYRASYAQGLAAIDLLTGWDHDGTVTVTRNRLTTDAIAATMSLYASGVTPDVTPPTGEPVVQPRNGERMLSAWSTQQVQGNGWSRHNGLGRNILEPALRGMANGYDPAKHGGVTLQKYLEDRNIPTSYVFHDSFHNHKQTSGGALTRYISYELRANIGEIRGNDYRERTINITKKDRAVRQDWTPWGGWKTNKESEKEADAWYKMQYDYWRSEARAHSQRWMDRYDAHSRLLLRDAQNNDGGWAADFGQQQVRKAAFPDA